MNVREIAKYLGVSPSTVSCVLNNKPGVSGERRRQITEELIKNGYALKTAPRETSGSICFVRYKKFRQRFSGDYHDTLFSKILEGAENVCRSMNYQLTVSIADFDDLGAILHQANTNHMNGILFFGSEYDVPDHNIFSSQPLPVVYMDNSFEGEHVNSVSMDNKDGIFLALNHLYYLGHRRIGLLKGSEPIGSLIERTNAFYSVMSSMHLDVDPRFVVELSPQNTEAYEQFSKFLSEKPPLPTAFVSESDSMAVGAIRALRENGYDVPMDISVIGFDDSPIATAVVPQLTSVRTYPVDIGAAAAMRLITIIKTGKLYPAVRSSVEVELIERESTANVFSPEAE